MGGGTSQPLVARAVGFYNDDNTRYIATDKTYAEVAEAISNGIPCYIGFKDIPEPALENVCEAPDSEVSAVIMPCMLPIFMATEDIIGVLIPPFTVGQPPVYALISLSTPDGHIVFGDGWDCGK